MPKNGPLIIVHDCIDDQNLICEALDQIKLKNRVEICCSAEQALEFLESTSEKPFMILTKMTLPGLSGLEFQVKVQENNHLRQRSVPFIFFSDPEPPEIVGQAYNMKAQGFFIVPTEFINLKLALFSITDYWQRSVHPSTGIMVGI